ncbi:unnamed protein product, partial [Closterium sp. NIES-54]
KFLGEVMGAWAKQFPGWQANGVCAMAWGLTCKDVSGRVASMSLPSQQLSGGIPSAISHLTYLTRLDLSSNQLSGSLPDFLGTLLNLQYLDLSGNALEGTIPSSFSNLVNLRSLSLHHNILSGPIPPFIDQAKLLSLLDLSNNHFTGPIPPQLATLTNLTTLSLASNEGLVGSIPGAIGNLTSLESLKLGSTQLNGSLPLSLSGLDQLTMLDISNTAISGSVPAFLGSLSDFLTFMRSSNMACNSTTDSSSNVCAMVSPSTVSRNSAFCRECPDLCSTCLPAAPSPTDPSQPSGSSSSSSSSTGLIVGVAVAVAVLLLLLLWAVLWWWRRREQGEKQGPSPFTVAVGEGEEPIDCQQYSIEDMRRATADWSSRNRIGTGGFGDVFRGASPYDPSVFWAVKRARVLTNDFLKEIEHMASKNHPCLVRLLGFCHDYNPRTQRMEQIVIYEFMDNGDLSQWTKAGGKHLTAVQLLDTLLSVAQGLAYLHGFDIVHRDIKPGNILLDKSMQAKLSDFGLLRMSESSTVKSTRVMGTPGYVDPTYAQTRKATTAADVYSFGILILELLTCKKAVFPVNNRPVHLRDWVSQQLHPDAHSAKLDDPAAILPIDPPPELPASTDLLEVIDPRLAMNQSAALRLLRLALSCTTLSLASRPSMMKLVLELETLRNEVLSAQQQSQLMSAQK